jgi:hypothetical protein
MECSVRTFQIMCHIRRILANIILYICHGCVSMFRLHTIQAVVALWVCRKRTGKTISGRPWPFHLAWVRCPEAYKMAALVRKLRVLVLFKHLLVLAALTCLDGREWQPRGFDHLNIYGQRLIAAASPLCWVSS